MSPVDTTALESQACAACGGDAEWNPQAQEMVCPFCGTIAPFERDAKSGQVREIDLVKTLRELPNDRRGWKGERRSVRCMNCDAISVFEAERVGQNCDFCGSPQLVDYNEIKPPIRPTGVLPFKMDKHRIRDGIRKWFGSKWLAPSAFKKRAMIDTVHGVYIPYWTFDANVVCPWTAMSGTYYYTPETYRDSKGRTRTRMKQNVRWTPASGTIKHVFDDTPIPGTRGLQPQLLAQMGRFPTQEVVPYETSYLAGFTVEHYQVVLVEAAELARKRMHGELQVLCGSAVPGDTLSNLQISPDYSEETFKHVLVPIWLLAYDYGGKSYQILANGYTGQIAGDYPKSWWKIAGLVGLALFAALLVLIATQL